MSLKDQLLKAGLTDKKKAKQVEQEKHKAQKLKQKNKVVVTDEARLAAQKAQVEKTERDRQLNLQRKQEAEQRALSAQIRQLIEMNRQPKGKGDITYHFTDHNKVVHIYVDERQQRQLANGLLAIVMLDGQYEIVPATVSNKIALRDESYLVYSNKGKQDAPAVEEDDPYAEFQVPDDLMW
ncbi:MAG: DUF2058 domain-containing protein [Chromatiales bacterium]|nr:DUF2058 domain-containing protein [Chromatiales bacterium]